MWIESDWIERDGNLIAKILLDETRKPIEIYSYSVEISSLITFRRLVNVDYVGIC